MDYQEVLENARGGIGPYCKVCPVCDGRGCGSSIPGPGAKGSGTLATRNYDAWQRIRINMDTLYRQHDVDTSIELFDYPFALPIFAGPVGAVQMHYGDRYTDTEYNDILVPACSKAGIAAFTADGTDPSVIEAGAEVIDKVDGMGIPTVKPWDMGTIEQKIDLIHEKCDPIAIAMDVDGAGLPFLQGLEPKAGPKSVDELAEIVQMADAPFIVKGIMTPRGAEKAVEAGASAILVSNHGGRVLDGTPATAEVLPQVVNTVGGDIAILVDGGIRSGLDVFRALALGADAVAIARPFVTAVYGGAGEGVAALVSKLCDELVDTMRMTGACSIDEIVPDMIWNG
jgi:4-hydroxymandelate oxidase